VVSDLKPSLQTLLVSEVGPTYAAALSVPFDATTQTFTAGPQLAYRHMKKVTLFIHPSIGAIHENISLNGSQGKPQPIASIVLAGLVAQHILTTTKPNDTTYFYGLGGGADYNLTKHFHLRADLEFVHVFLYSNLLKDSRNSVRLSVGPTCNHGLRLPRRSLRFFALILDFAIDLLLHSAPSHAYRAPHHRTPNRIRALSQGSPPGAAQPQGSSSLEFQRLGG
jgi:hypothetical protein